MKHAVLGVLAMVALAGATVSAHHSFAAEFDANKPVTLRGTLKSVELVNPHGWIHIDVKNADGTVTNWAFSGGAPGQLMRRGITREALKIGAEVVVEGFRAKDASNNGFGQKVTFPDGRNVFTAAPPSQQ